MGHISQKLQMSDISNLDLYFIPLNLVLKFYVCIIYLENKCKNNDDFIIKNHPANSQIVFYIH
jgi:hypothetical protein